MSGRMHRLHQRDKAPPDGCLPPTGDSYSQTTHACVSQWHDGPPSAGVSLLQGSRLASRARSAEGGSRWLAFAQIDVYGRAHIPPPRTSISPMSFPSHLLPPRSVQSSSATCYIRGPCSPITIASRSHLTPQAFVRLREQLCNAHPVLSSYQRSSCVSSGLSRRAEVRERTHDGAVSASPILQVQGLPVTHRCQKETKCICAKTLR